MAGWFERNPRKVIARYFNEREAVVFPYLLLFGAPAIISLSGLGLIMSLLAGLRSGSHRFISGNFTLSLGLTWVQIGASGLAIAGFGTLLFLSLWRGDLSQTRISARSGGTARERRLVTTLELFVRLAPFYWGVYLVSLIGFVLLALFLTSLGLWQPVIGAGSILLASLVLSGAHVLKYLLGTGPKNEPVPAAVEQDDEAVIPGRRPRISWLLRGLAVLLTSPPGRVLGGGVLLPALILGAVLLPVAAGVEAYLDFGPQRISRRGGALQDFGRLEVAFPPEGVSRPFWVQSEAIPRGAFLEGERGPDLVVAAESMPSFLQMKSAFYRFYHKGPAPTRVVLTIQVPPAEPDRLLDLYTWQEAAWRWLPSRKNAAAGTLETTLSYLPPSVVVMETRPLTPHLSTTYAPNEPLLRGAQEALAEIYPQGLQLGRNGRLTGQVADLSAEFLVTSLPVIPTIRNWDEASGVQSDLVTEMLEDPRLQAQHIEAIVEMVRQNNYQGVDLDYRGLAPRLRPVYTDFLTRLRTALPAGKQLAVHVEFPDQISGDTWDTGAYDWVALGRLADVVKLPPAPRPDMYGPGRQMEGLLDWAVGRVNRFKLQPILDANSLELVDGVARPLTLTEAFAPLEAATIALTADRVEPGQAVELDLASQAAPVTIQFDRASGHYRFIYNDESGQRRLIYVENAATISNKLQFLKRYNLRGVELQNLLQTAVDSPLWPVIRHFPGLAVPPLTSEYGLIWRIKNQQGEIVDHTILELSDSTYTWIAADSGGVYDIEAAIVAGRDRTEIIPVGQRSLRVTGPGLRATPAAVPRPTFTPTLPLPLTFSPTVLPDPTPTPQPAPAPPPPISETPPPGAPGGCPEPPRGEFARLWQTRPEAFGCPIETEPLAGVFVEMPFEQGRLVWMKDIERYGDVNLALALMGGQNEGDTGTWALRTENWQGEGVCPVGPPPDGLYLPDRNLAQVWCDMNGLEKLGYAMRPQEIVVDGGEAALQNFENVIILKDSHGQAQGLAYVLFRADNTYRRMAY